MINPSTPAKTKPWDVVCARCGRAIGGRAVHLDGAAYHFPCRTAVRRDRGPEESSLIGMVVTWVMGAGGKGKVARRYPGCVIERVSESRNRAHVRGVDRRGNPVSGWVAWENLIRPDGEAFRE